MVAKYVMTEAVVGGQARQTEPVSTFVDQRRYTVHWDPVDEWPASRPADAPAGMIDYDSSMYEDAYPPPASIMVLGDRWVPDPRALATSYDTVFDGLYHVIKNGPPTDVGPEPAPFPVAGLGGAAYSAALIATWTDDSEWTRMASGTNGNYARPYTAVGSSIPTIGSAASATLQLISADTAWCRVQAILSIADPNPTSKANREDAVSDYIDMWANNQPVFEVNTSTQTQRLNSAWYFSNILRAARLIGYTNTDLEDYVRDYLWNPSNTSQTGPTLWDWSANGNWDATFCECKLYAAIFLGDAALWQQARLKYRTRLAESIYHALYDGAAIVPKKSDAGVVSNSNTVGHWGGFNKNPTPQVAAPAFLANFPSGWNSESMRDHGHCAMAYTSWINGAFTILAQGETLFIDEIDRLEAGINVLAGRVRPYFNNGTMTAPWPIGNNTLGDNTPGLEGLGGSNASSMWFAGKALLTDTGQTVSSDLSGICVESEVTSYSPTGANHQGSDLYAFGA
jgi:hypothetical protein